MSTVPELTFYVVRNLEGRYFRRKGYGGGGDTWVADIERARVYAKIGPARAVVSFFVSKYPQFGTPEILVMKAQLFEVLNETERVQKAIESKKLAKEKQELAEVNRQLAYAKEQQARLTEKIASLKKRAKED